MPARIARNSALPFPVFSFHEQLLFCLQVTDEPGAFFLAKVCYHPESVSPAPAVQDECTAPAVIKFEYHVVYSISYSVPVLYFKATKQGMRATIT